MRIQTYLVEKFIKPQTIIQMPLYDNSKKV